MIEAHEEQDRAEGHDHRRPGQGREIERENERENESESAEEHQDQADRSPSKCRGWNGHIHNLFCCLAVSSINALVARASSLSSV